jgi:hypothetical protein
MQEKLELKRKTMRSKMIIIPHGMRKDIALELGVSTVTVYSAIRGISEGPKSDAVRKLALQKIKEIK